MQHIRTRCVPCFRRWSRKGWCRLYVEASNITDTSYCDLGGIPLPGAWVTGGVTLTFGK